MKQPMESDSISNCNKNMTCDKFSIDYSEMATDQNANACVVSLCLKSHYGLQLGG